MPLPATVPPACLPQAQELRDFLLPMLDFDPARRATAAEMLAHPWLQQDLPPQQRALPTDLVTDLVNAQTAADTARETIAT